jgi:HEAT repeat protein
MNKKTASLALVVALALGAAALGVKSTSSSSAAASPRAATSVTDKHENDGRGAASTASETSRDLHLGAQFTYDVKAERVYADGAGKLLTQQTDAGRLVITVVGQKDGGAAMRAELQSSSEPSLSAPFFFVLGDDGSVKSYGFAKSIPGEARNKLRALVSSLQVAPSSVERVEGDVSGEALVGYVRTGSNVVRTKVRYERVRTPAGLTEPAVIGGSYDVTSRAVFELDASGWPTTLVEDEVLSVGFKAGKMTMKAKTTAKLVAKGENKGFAGSYDSAASGFDPDVDALGDSARLAKTNADKGLVAGATFTTLTSDLETSKDQHGRNKAVARMGALFRTSPESIGEARAKLLSRSTPEATARALAGALQDANSKEAQRALADALASDVPSSVKSSAAISLGLSPDPTPEAKSSLSTASRSADQDLSSTATLALGNLARSGGDSASDVVSDLLARLDAASTPADKALILDALGNSGSPAALDAILASTTDDAPIVRAAAFGALKLMHDERVAKALPMGMFDASGNVRQAAIAASGMQDLSLYADVLSLVLHKSDDAETRLAAVRVLARGVNSVAAAEAALSWTATNDPEPRVRDAATQALSKPKK